MPQLPQSLSKRIQDLKASSTVAFNTKAKDMQRNGIDVIAMTAGEPDFQPPEHITEAAHEAIRKGLTKYTAAAGTVELREAVASKFKRENGLDFSPNQVIVSTGGKQVLYNAIMALVEPGDEVIVPAPFWVSYPAQVQLAGGTLVPVMTTPENGFVPRVEDVVTAMSDKTKVLMLNSPSNPTGAVYPREVLEGIVKAAVERDIWIIADDLYEHLVYDGEFTSIASLAPEHTFTVHGASKAYALTGWRIGYGAGPEILVKAMTRLQGQVTSATNAVAQYATIAALNEVDKTRAFIDMTKKAYIARRDVLVAGLNALGLHTPKPSGAFYVMADVSSIDADEGKAAMALLEQAHVATVPGTDFLAKGHVRLSYATSMENIETALERLKTFLANR